jgi:pimeloyl-ACP methyl ester carboxylesterase
MMECELESITVHYEVFGEGTPLVVLHGWPADHQSMVRAFEPIFELRGGWKRIYPDLPGMGETPGMEWIENHDDMLQIVTDFIDCVAPEQNVAIAGYSYGGHLAQGVVYQRPATVDGLFLLAPYIEDGCPIPAHITLVKDEALFEDLDPAVAAAFRGIAVVQNEKTLYEFEDGLGRAAELADQAFLARLAPSLTFSFDVRALPEPFDRPALILTGRQDSGTGYCGAWNLLDNYPRATYAVLDRAGHVLPWEQEHLFRVLVDEWLDRVEEYRSY